MESIAEAKALMRADARKSRRDLPIEVRRAAEARIRGSLWKLLADAEDLLCYLSTPEEVDTHEFLREWIAEGRRAFAPAIENPGHLSWRPVLELDNLALGRFGIPEPPSPAKPAVIDPKWPVVVPCVAFAPNGARLGSGGGYYDRFLVHHDGPAIGIAFECQRRDPVPTEPHDALVRAVVTELGTYPPIDIPLNTASA